MVAPLIPVAMIAGSALAGAGANWYSQAKQRELYRYQRNAYERQERDWHRNVRGREIRYPELSYPGHIRALDTGISQSYASSVGTGAHLTAKLAGSYVYGRSNIRSLFGASAGRTSKWL